MLLSKKFEFMENTNDPSSPLGFASSSYPSNGSITHNVSANSNSESGANIDNLSLNKLSGNLKMLLDDAEFDYSDAEIIVDGISVGVHRCILATRSPFFHELFKKGNNSLGKEGKPRYLMSDLMPYGTVGYEAFGVFLNYMYTGKLKPSPPVVSTCIDNACAHDACRPAINYAVELMYASATFQMKELVSLVQRRLLSFVVGEKVLVEDVIPILVAAFRCQLDQLLSHCIPIVACSSLDIFSLEKELPHEVSSSIKSLRLKSQREIESGAVKVDPMHEKAIRRIHKALDSDDVELVKLLLSESVVTLDDAHALHYAVAYCDPKVVMEVLNLGMADLNLRNSRGYTVLHVAARRKEPLVIEALLAKGACASETTSDDQGSLCIRNNWTALTICRRLIRPKDYNEKTEPGKESNKDRRCIDVLERQMLRNPMAGSISISLPVITDDLKMRLYNLENRVAFARAYFPSQAKLAMDIAHAHSTLEFAGFSASKGSCGNLRVVSVSETATMQTKTLQLRLEALVKTVEMGRYYFPHCSEVLDELLEDDSLFLKKGTPEERTFKKKRLMELKEDLQNAFFKDIAGSRPGLSSSSSSSTDSPRERVIDEVRKN